MRWVNLPIYPEVRHRPIKQWGCVYGGKNLGVAEQGLIVGYPAFEELEWGRYKLCKNPQYAYNDRDVIDLFTGFDYTTRDVRYSAELLCIVNGLTISGKAHTDGLYVEGYRADSVYYTKRFNFSGSVSRNHLGLVRDTYLRTVEVWFREALPDSVMVRLQCGPYLSNEMYNGVEAQTSYLFTFPADAWIGEELLEFAVDDGTIASAVGYAEEYEDSGNFDPEYRPSIHVNGTICMGALAWTGRYIVGVETDAMTNLVYTEFPLDFQVLHIGEQVKHIGYHNDMLFVFSPHSVFEVDLQTKQVNRICSVPPYAPIQKVVSTDLGIYAMSKHNVFFLTKQGLQELFYLPDDVITDINPSWNNKTVWILCQKQTGTLCGSGGGGGGPGE